MSIVAPLGSSAYFLPSINGLQSLSSQLANSVNCLATGNRILTASDDVAGFSTASQLQSHLAGLRQATKNLSQGSSLLQIADSGVSQIGSLLSSIKALTVQAASAALTTPARAQLQQQLAAYLDEIDSIAANTSFNGIALLSGSLSGQNKAFTQTAAATRATAQLSFSTLAIGETVKIGGVTLTTGVEFAVGLSLAATLDNLTAALNASTDARLSQATYSHVAGSSILSVAYKAGGAQGNQFVIDKANSTATFNVSGLATTAANIYTLAGGRDDGLAIGGVTASGAIGNAVITTQAQTAASVVLTLTAAAGNNETLVLDNGNGGSVTFTFKTTATPDTAEIQIGATTEETLQNVVKTITAYSAANAGNNNYGLRQLDFAISGSTLTLTNRRPGNATRIDGTTALSISETLTNGSLSRAAFDNGVNTGVNASGVTNSAFFGSIGGFSASYVSADKVTASITVGSHTYTATIADTTPGVATTVRFSSDGGGYFDIQLAAAGQAVTNPTTATAYAGLLDAAFDGLTFSQSRSITNYSSTGLSGSSASIHLSDFTGISLNSISVTAPVSPSTDATIDITINGTIFRASTGIGGHLGAYEKLKFISLDDPTQFLTFQNGATAQDFSDDTAAETFQAALRSAFGLAANGPGVTFQVGTGENDTIAILIDSASAAQLFSGFTPDLSSVANAAAAGDLTDNAINALQSIQSLIGGYQSRVSAASLAIDAATQGTNSAYSSVSDTDYVEETSLYIQSLLKTNVSVAALAQARILQSGLLDVLRAARSF